MDAPTFFNSFSIIYEAIDSWAFQAGQSLRREAHSFADGAADVDGVQLPGHTNDILQANILLSAAERLNSNM